MEKADAQFFTKPWRFTVHFTATDPFWLQVQWLLQLILSDYKCNVLTTTAMSYLRRSKKQVQGTEVNQITEISLMLGAKFRDDSLSLNTPLRTAV